MLLCYPAASGCKVFLILSLLSFRQGADNFKHGIAILTAADYFSLGNRTDAYLNIALTIAEFDEYQKPIIRYLSGVKLHHWDSEMRSLTSQSLARIAKLNPQFCAKEILPMLLGQSFHDDLVQRHGSLLGAAEMILALGELDLIDDKDIFGEGIKSTIVELVPSIEKARLYRGRGGEIMRSASCRMIECISLAKLSMTVKQQVSNSLVHFGFITASHTFFIKPPRFVYWIQLTPAYHTQTKRFSEQLPRL